MEVVGGALGAAAAIGAASAPALREFSARHDKEYIIQQGELMQIIRRFEDSRGKITADDLEEFHILREKAMAHGASYFATLHAYKQISSVHVGRKRAARAATREGKGAFQDAVRQLRELLEDAIHCGPHHGDSTAAVRGSALNDPVQDWLTDTRWNEPRTTSAAHEQPESLPVVLPGYNGHAKGRYSGERTPPGNVIYIIQPHAAPPHNAAQPARYPPPMYTVLPPPNAAAAAPAQQYSPYGPSQSHYHGGGWQYDQGSSDATRQRGRRVHQDSHHGRYAGLSPSGW